MINRAVSDSEEVTGGDMTAIMYRLGARISRPALVKVSRDRRTQPWHERCVLGHADN